MVPADRDNNSWNFLWVVDFPMFEFNAEENRLEALHHPFCAPNTGDLGDDPGRWADTRPPTRQELKATAILALPLDEASAKVRSGPPGNAPEDAEDYAGTWTDNLNGTFSLLKDAQTLTFSQATGAVNVMAVPEPAALGLVAAAVGGCWWRFRRRVWAHRKRDT